MSKNNTIKQKNVAAPVTDSSGTPISQDKTCECCEDPVFIHMKDNYHEFSMGLFTILQCLRFLEQEGHVPTLPEGWWVQLANRYHLRL